MIDRNDRQCFGSGYLNEKRFLNFSSFCFVKFIPGWEGGGGYSILVYKPWCEAFVFEIYFLLENGQQTLTKS